MRIANVVYDSIVDGPGIRTVIFFQGCPHHCKGCHNESTWDKNQGTELSIDQLLAFIIRGESKKITYSGGEPFLDSEGLEELTRVLKSRGYSVGAYSGYTWEKLKDLSVVPMLDFIVDSPYIEELKTLDLPFRGSSNQRFVDVKKSLETGRLCEYDFSKLW